MCNVTHYIIHTPGLKLHTQTIKNQGLTINTHNPNKLNALKNLFADTTLNL